jgi:hypothetical protein
MVKSSFPLERGSVREIQITKRNHYSMHHIRPRKIFTLIDAPLSEQIVDVTLPSDAHRRNFAAGNIPDHRRASCRKCAAALRIRDISWHQHPEYGSQRTGRCHGVHETRIN